MRDRLGRLLMRAGLRLILGPRSRYAEVLVNGKPT